MAEYTYADIIMDPNDPRLEGAIGKECYFSDYPKEVLDYARNHSEEYRLKSIEKEENFPFVDNNHEDNWAVVIIKKEEPKKYVPFENADEFFDAYDSANYSVKNETVENKLLNYGGIWLKGKDSGAHYMVTEIWSCGVVIGDINIDTTKIQEDEYLTVNRVTKWKELLEYYTLLNGSPCGKDVKE